MHQHVYEDIAKWMVGAGIIIFLGWALLRDMLLEGTLTSGTFPWLILLITILAVIAVIGFVVYLLVREFSEKKRDIMIENKLKAKSLRKSKAEALQELSDEEQRYLIRKWIREEKENT